MLPRGGFGAIPPFVPRSTAIAGLSMPVMVAGGSTTTTTTSDWFSSRERKLACLQVLKDVGEKLRSNSAAIACIRRFPTLDDLLTHLQSVDEFETSSRIDYELFSKGEIDQTDIARLGGTDPFTSFDKANPLNRRVGIYKHAVTLRLRSGKTATFIYVGSANEGLDKPTLSTIGFCGRMKTYDVLNRGLQRIQLDTADRESIDSFLKSRQAVTEHGYTGWPLMTTEYGGSCDGATVLKSAWWVAMSQARSQVYTSVCGGDVEAGKQLQPLHLGDKKSFEDIRLLLTGWIHLMEGYQTLYSGVAPTSVASNTAETNHTSANSPPPRLSQNKRPVAPLVHAAKTNTHRVWIPNPRIQTSNLRLQLFEQGGQSGTSVSERQYTSTVDGFLTNSLTSLARIKAYYNRCKRFQPLPSDAASFKAIGLLDLGKENHKTAVQGPAEKFYSHLKLVHHETDGAVSVRSQVPIALTKFRSRNGTSVETSMFPLSQSEFWSNSIQEFLRRQHPDCVDDAPSYRANASPPAVDFWVALVPPKGATHFRVEIFALDRQGLVRADGTGVRIVWYHGATGKQIGEPLERAFGDETTSPAQESLARACAVLRTILAVARKNNLALGFPLFLQSPVVQPVPIDVDDQDDDQDDHDDRANIVPFDQDLFDWGKTDLDAHVAEFASLALVSPPIIWPILQRDEVIVPAINHGYIPLSSLPPSPLPDTPKYGYLQACVANVPRRLAHESRTYRHVRPVLSQTWSRRNDPSLEFINLGSFLGCKLEMHTLLGQSSFWTIFLDLSQVVPSEHRWRFHRAIELGLEQPTLTINQPAYVIVKAAPDNNPPAYTIRLDQLPHPCPGHCARFNGQDYEERLVVVRGSPNDRREIDRGPNFLFQPPEPGSIAPRFDLAMPPRPIHLEQAIGMDLDHPVALEAAGVANAVNLSLLGRELVRWMEMTMQMDCSRLEFARPLLAYDLLLRDGVAPSLPVTSAHLLALLRAISRLPWVDVGLALFQTILSIYNAQDPLPHVEYDLTFEQLPWTVVRQIVAALPPRSALQQIAPPPLHNLAPRLWHCWRVGGGGDSLLVVEAGQSISVHGSWSCPLTSIERIHLHPHGQDTGNTVVLVRTTTGSEFSAIVIVDDSIALASELSRWCTGVCLQAAPAFGHDDLDMLLDQLSTWLPAPLPAAIVPDEPMPAVVDGQQPIGQGQQQVVPDLSSSRSNRKRSKVEDKE